MARLLLLVFSLLVLPGSVWATPSALIQIPTTDILDDDTACVDLGVTAYLGQRLDDEAVYQGNQVSLFPQVEFGWDWPLSGFGEGILNVKWRFLRHRSTSFSVGLGGIQPGRTGESYGYLVGSREHAKWRGHLGVAVSDHWYGFAGVEYFANENLTWVADWVTGPSGAASAGVSWTFGPEDEWCLMLGAIRDNVGRGRALYGYIGRTFSF